MALATIDNLKTTLGIGARPNLFKIEFTWPQNVLQILGDSAATIANKANFLCKAAAIPAFTVGVIEVPYRGGRRIKVPGDRTFGDWTVTFLSDEAHFMRNFLNTWTEYIKSSNYESSSLRAELSNSASDFDYLVDIEIYQLNSKGVSTRHYKLFDAFPTDVGAVDLSFDSTDSISEFTTTFQYHSLTAIPDATDITKDTEIT